MDRSSPIQAVLDKPGPRPGRHTVRLALARFGRNQRVLFLLNHALLFSMCLALPLAAEAAHDTGPRAPRLTDLHPRSSIVFGGELALFQNATGLSLPIAARIEISPELVLEVELPFGYVSVPGEVVDPMVGNLGFALVGSTLDRLGRNGMVRWGLEISGRAPTGPDLEDLVRAERFARLRALSPFRSERWTPGAAAIRIDVAVAYGTRDLGGQLQSGVTGALPIADGPATAHPHYGLSIGRRLHRSLWIQGELVGAWPGPGATDDRAGHYLCAAVAFRLVMVRTAPVAYVSVPVAGEVDGDRPVVIGVELASW